MLLFDIMNIGGNMVYLIYGTNDYLIKNKKNEIIKNTNKLNITNYDLENTKIENIIDDASCINLFDDEKTIIVDNTYIFNATNNKKNMEQNIDIVEEYLNNPNPNTTIIFISNNQKLDERKKITKLIRNVGKVLEFNNITNNIEEIKKELKDYKIESKVIETLIDRVGDNLDIIKNEIEKIKLYKDNNTITLEDIILLTNKNINTDIFNLIEHIVNKNKEKAYLEYKEIIKNGEEPMKILIMLANQFRLIYQASELYKKGYTEGDIASSLDIHPYRIKLALNKSRNYDNKIILKYIYDLALLDIDIKTSKIDPNLGLELFIINI